VGADEPSVGQGGELWGGAVAVLVEVYLDGVLDEELLEAVVQVAGEDGFDVGLSVGAIRGPDLG